MNLEIHIVIRNEDQFAALTDALYQYVTNSDPEEVDLTEDQARWRLAAEGYLDHLNTIMAGLAKTEPRKD